MKEIRIPKKYWNSLVTWTADSPYDGCWWELNAGCVDRKGDFRPLYAEGRTLNLYVDAHESRHGLVPDPKSVYDHSPGWWDREHQKLKESCGFGSVEDVDAQMAALWRVEAERAYGKDGIYRHYLDFSAPEVKVALASALERKRRYDEGLDALRETARLRLNALFMGAATDCTPDDWRVLPIGTERSIKRTCGDLCGTLRGDKGKLVEILDGLVSLGYSPWCVCSECDEMFRLSDSASFSELLDEDSYRGDGGIGVLYDRILCERCSSETWCPECLKHTLPVDDSGYGGMAFAKAFVSRWLGVCEGCAERWLDANGKWQDALDGFKGTIDEGNRQLKEYMRAKEREGDYRASELLDLRAKNEDSLCRQWAELANSLRERMADDARRMDSADEGRILSTVDRHDARSWWLERAE